MSFENLWYLNFLWILPLLAVSILFEERKKREARKKFADTGLLDNLSGLQLGKRKLLSPLLKLSALFFIIFSLTGPRWGMRYQEVSRKGVDIIIVLDVSLSMMVEDIKPNRLERAKREILDLFNVLKGDRIGLIAFAGEAFVQFPLTLDYEAGKMFLDELKPGIIPTPGTDLGHGIELALKSFEEKSTTDKVILLITDGEDNEGKGLEIAKKAGELGIRIFVFGMGDPAGGPIPGEGDNSGFIKDSNGKIILSKLDESGLKKIAKETGGDYVRSVTGDLDLDILYFNGIKLKTRDQTLKSGKIKVYEEKFFLFIGLALIILLWEGFVDERIKKGREAIEKL